MAAGPACARRRAPPARQATVTGGAHAPPCLPHGYAPPVPRPARQARSIRLRMRMPAVTAWRPKTRILWEGATHVPLVRLVLGFQGLPALRFHSPPSETSSQHEGSRSRMPHGSGSRRPRSGCNERRVLRNRRLKFGPREDPVTIRIRAAERVLPSRTDQIFALDSTSSNKRICPHIA